MTNVIIKGIHLPSHRASFDMYVIGDLHYGAINTDVPAFKRAIKDIVSNARKRKTKVILMGDYINVFPKTDTREDMRVDKKIDPLLAYTEFRDMIKPIAPYIDVILSGNHDEDWYRAERTDFINWLTVELRTLNPEIENGTCESYIRYKISREGSEFDSNLDVIAWHGSGGAGTTSGAVSQTMTPLKNFPTANLYLVGHYHRLGMWHQQRLILNEKIKDFVTDEQYFVMTGSYLRGFVPPVSTYISKRMLPPITIGCPKLTIQPFKAVGTLDSLDIKMEEIR